VVASECGAVARAVEPWRTEDGMGEAREAMDRVTAATNAQDRAAVKECYAEDAVLRTPDQGDIRGRDDIASYLLQLHDAFPDAAYEYAGKFEDGSTAIDEGYLTGTHTGPLRLESGDIIEPTGKRLRVRSCDIAEVEMGVIRSHRMYFSTADFAEQLGLG
jgi:ketosteroid isomerase-like protein